MRMALVLAALLAATFPANAAAGQPERPAEMAALDAVRRPAEILAFFGLRPGMTVIDLPADGGYYSELMARAVGPRGHVITLIPEGLRGSFAGVAERNPNVALRTALLHAVAPENVTAGEAHFALLHIMYHDVYWDEPGVPPVDPDRLLRALYRMVRPGGAVGVIDFVGGSGDTRAIVNRLHRIDPGRVRADFERAGFVFEAESSLLRRSDDDHSRSAVDPAMRNRSDLFVLRFRRPAEPTTH